MPMLEPMRIACDDRGFVSMRVISMIAVTVRTVLFVIVLVLVMVRFIRCIVMMDVRMISSDMTMIEGAQDIDRMLSNSVSIIDAIIFPPSVNAVSRLEQCRIDDRRYPVGRQGTAQTRSSEVLSP
jgi:hypothetical protein